MLYYIMYHLALILDKPLEANSDDPLLLRLIHSPSYAFESESEKDEFALPMTPLINLTDANFLDFIVATGAMILVTISIVYW